MAEELKAQELDEYKRTVEKKQKAIQVKKLHQPKTRIDKVDKIILFGHIYYGKTEEEGLLYQFCHKRVDGVITEGYIPVGFLSSIEVLNQLLFLAIRKGELGPEFQLSMRTPSEVIADWDMKPDVMWATVLNYFDKKAVFPEAILDYLDADPFVLFGIDDLITQRALKKLEKQPVLLSRGEKPDIMEWADYLGGRVAGNKSNTKIFKNLRTRWVIQAFAETELPTPWTSYKGIGNIVCFMNHETGVCSWKHPFYDYFFQLVNFCQDADEIDVKRIRINRIIWNYEASQSTGVIQQPLVSPEYVEQLADTMGFDVSEEPYFVRSLKAALKNFSQQYRLHEDVDKESIIELQQRLLRDAKNNKVMLKTWNQVLTAEVSFDLEALANGKLQCIECDHIAMSFCLECKDYFCGPCFSKLHSKGNRKNHVPFRLIACTMCDLSPSKVHCSFTDKSFCHECYAMRHVTQLPEDARENAPKKINYARQQSSMIKKQQEQHMADNVQECDDADIDTGSCTSVLTSDWHQFFDTKGIKYYYNFRTGAHMRRSPNASPAHSSKSVSEAGTMSPAAEKTDPSLNPRAIRAPYRSHPDSCNFKDIDTSKWKEEMRTEQQAAQQ